MTQAVVLDVPPRAAARVVPPSPPFVHSGAKRALDLIVSVLALLLGAPLFAAVAVAVRLTSPGPVFFRQRRAGLRGEPFTVLKFRTMWDGASEAPHRDYVSSLVRGRNDTPRDGIFKLVGDRRVTRVGRVLRRTGLDELPQLLNVLRGEMSVVGPRPPLEYEVELYEPWQLERLAVKPGLTGLWQVSGRNALDYVDMCTKDIEYIRQWSFASDLAIVARTPFAMFFKSAQAA